MRSFIKDVIDGRRKHARKNSRNLISDTIMWITFPSTNGTPFRWYLEGTAIELSRGIIEISADLDKGTCTQIRTPLNSPLSKLPKSFIPFTRCH